MPPLALRYLRTAFAFLIYGVSIGLHHSAAINLGWAPFRSGYVPAHTHVLTIGFLVMLIAGLGLWRLPTPARGTKPWMPLACWWLITGTVVARSSAEVLSGYVEARWVGAAVFSASCLQGLGLWALGWHLLARAGEAARKPARDAPG